jgi:hypothetical protein
MQAIQLSNFINSTLFYNNLSLFFHSHSFLTYAGENKWEYPSPQMFFNAMKRKGWEPKEEDMGVIVAIHNAVNERSWRQVFEWEKLHPE